MGNTSNKRMPETVDEKDSFTDSKQNNEPNDISRSPAIKCIHAFPDSNWDINNAYKADTSWHSGEVTKEIRKQEVYLIFDLNDVTIDSISITLVNDKYRDDRVKEPNNAGTIKLYTSNESDADLSVWHLLGTKKNMKKEENAIFDLQCKHKKYIRIGISKIHKKTRNVCIGTIIWKGFEPIIKDEITDKISVFQTSNRIINHNIDKILFNKDQTFWESNTSDRCFIIFDCNRYEIHQIHILFKDKSKPGIVKLRLSDIGNAYSFRIPSVKRWQLNTCQTDYTQDWKHIDLLEMIQINDNIYKSGFKRYLQFEFSEYMKSQLGIVYFRFFGTLSQQIADDSEQFDAILDVNHEKKECKEELKTEEKDDSLPYKPRVFKHSPPHPRREEHPIDNIWGGEYSYFYLRLPGFIIIDSGNNEIEEIRMSSHYQYGCKKVKISTSDDPTDDKWMVIHENDAYHMDDGKGYHVSGKHKKYIQLEFDDSLRTDTNFYGLETVELFGESQFLQQRLNVTLDDIKNMKIVDKDLVERYINGQQKELSVLSTTIMNRNKADPDYADFGYGPEWIAKAKDYWLQIDAKKVYFKLQVYAYTEPTVFEQQQMLQIAAMKKKIADEFALKKTRAISNDNQREKEVGKQLEELEGKRFAEQHSKHPDQSTIIQLQKQYDSLLIEYRSRHDRSELNIVSEERDQALEAVYKDTSNENVYECWKESIEHHPLVISDKYNIKDYEAMMKWATKHKSTEMNKLWMRLIQLLDKSLNERKILLHKYFLFVLSGQSLQGLDELRHKGAKPSWILFDCGTKIIDRVEIKLQQDSFASNKTDRIEMYSADEFTEEKIDRNGDTETEMNWNNFNLIGEVKFEYDANDEESNRTITFEQSRYKLMTANQRYLRIVIMDKWGGSPASLRVEQIKLFVHSKDDNEVDEDETNGFVADKYKLKLVDSTDSNIVSNQNRNRWDGFDNVYTISAEVGYKSPRGIKQPYLVFDCNDPIRKIDKMEIQFADEWGSTLKTITVSSSDTFNADDMKGNEEWIEIFTDKINDRKMFCAKYTTNINTIDIGRKNQRYLKLSFTLQDDSKNFMLKYLKFCAVNVDDNIKNLTRKIKVVKASPSKDGRVIDNIYHDQYRAYYQPRDQWSGSYKEKIGAQIRDEVCIAVNKIRGGGTISSIEKQFVKGLLCWKNRAHYYEILLTSIRIMNILSKTLIEEYKKLQEKNSKLLTLKLDEKDVLPKNIVSNHGLLEWDYSKWYQYRKAYFYPEDLNGLAEEWINLGLKLSDKEFKHLRRNGVIDKAKSFTSSAELAMEYLNLIAFKLDPSFQNAMKCLFQENRKNLNLFFPTDNSDLGVLSGPVKTKARQNIKVKLDYYDKAPPQCMAVLDIVRCAIVCETDVELCSLFELMNSKYSGKILRIKNAFDDVNKGTFGYRAVLMNIAYGDEKLLPKEYQMICEVQLLLLKYYQVRKSMHLGYGIVRSEEGGLSHDRQPYVVLAEDSCKFGKLDI